MRFWIKFGLLTVVGYFACYASFLAQDRQEHHAIVREVESVTRDVITVDMNGGHRAEVQEKLADARRKLDRSEARWQSDAHHLLLLSFAD